jgi:hypothetical protein
MVLKGQPERLFDLAHMVFILTGIVILEQLITLQVNLTSYT